MQMSHELEVASEQLIKPPTGGFLLEKIHEQPKIHMVQ